MVRNTNKLLLDKLDKYGYKYTEEDTCVCINIGLGLSVCVTTSELNKVSFAVRTKGYSVLSGYIPFSFRNLMIYTLITHVIISICFSWFMFIAPSQIPILAIIYLFWSFCMLGVILFYLIRIEAVKKTVIDWIDTACDESA